MSQMIATAGGAKRQRKEKENDKEKIYRKRKDFYIV
jgi:hypothetical protein